MPSVDAFNVNSTSVELDAPADTTGLERIMLAATGNLQRLLSTFFRRPISIETIYAHTGPREQPASVENPIQQSRQVHLVCESRPVVIATSDVTLTSPETERLFLDEKYPIGQLFRKIGRTPTYTLLSSETKVTNGKRELNRKYRLEAEGVICDILEVFPDRDMFELGEAWFQKGASTLEVQERPFRSETVA